MSYVLTYIKENNLYDAESEKLLGDLSWGQRRDIVAATGGSNIQVRIAWHEACKYQEDKILEAKIAENDTHLRTIREEDELINQIRDKRERLQRQKEREERRSEELRAKGALDPLVQELYLRYVDMIEMKQADIEQLKRKEQAMTGTGEFTVDQKDLEWAIRADQENFEEFLRTEDKIYQEFDKTDRTPEDHQQNLDYLENRLREVMKERHGT